MPIRRCSPDSLSRMVSCMQNDEEIMGLCGETKIGNKAETWVYYDSRYCSSLRRRVWSFSDHFRSFRVLHLASLDEGFRIHVRRCHLFCQDASACTESRRRRATPVSGYPSSESGHCRALLGERGRHIAQEEPTTSRRGSLFDDAHVEDVPQAKDDLLSSSCLQDCRAGHFRCFAFATSSLD